MSFAPDDVGHDAGWHLAFFTEQPRGIEQSALSIGAGDYYAEISASLPAGLEGGTYSFAIEGIINRHYKALHEIWNAKPRKPLYVDLYLYWRDTVGVLGYLASVAGLTDTVDSLSGKPSTDKRVARLVVTRLSRRVGPRRYEAVIEARERVYDALTQRLAKPPSPSTNPLKMAATVTEKLVGKGSCEKHPLKTAVKSTGPSPKFEPIAGKKGTTVLSELARAMEAEAKKSGLPMYVIRDGKLHIGPGRPIPLEGKAKQLDAAHGLVHVETTAVAVADEPEDLDSPIPKQPPSHLQYALTLKGRPDLRPGDEVTFADPFDDGQGNDPASALNATTTPSGIADAVKGIGTSLFGGASALVRGAVTMYVTSVSHRVSRSEGFVTSVAGKGVQKGEEWDEVVPEKGSSPLPPPAASTHDELAGALHDMVKSMQPDMITAAEVRAYYPSGTSEPPAQTIDVWVGLEPDDGMPAGVRRLAIDRDRKSKQTGVPMVTPFAWGRSGLVVPRYPGTRVLLAHAHGSEHEPVDIGALWESGHGPESQAGDWWLILPANVDSQVRQSISDEDTPQEPTGAATNDLINAEGERVIEAGRLTVRVIPNNLQPPGARPDAGDSANRVTIEHESGSKIVIKDNGDIIIESSNDLMLKTRSTMTFEADDINVKVKNAMDVGDRT